VAGLLKERESSLEIAICHLLHIRKIFFYKSANRGYFDGKRYRKDYNPYTRKGIPDITIILKGRFVGFEVKTSTGRQSPDQKQFQADLEANGGFYFIVRSVKDAEEALNKLHTLII
jgi:hypothetical protein